MSCIPAAGVAGRRHGAVDEGFRRHAAAGVAAAGCSKRLQD
jgi:hypothetical protein